MGKKRALETLQQMLEDYRSTTGITDRVVLDKIIKDNCDITARACKCIGDDQEEDSPLYFAAYNTRREAIDLSGNAAARDTRRTIRFRLTMRTSRIR